MAHFLFESIQVGCFEIWIDSTHDSRFMKTAIRFSSWLKLFLKSVIRFDSWFKQKSFDSESTHDSTSSLKVSWPERSLFVFHISHSISRPHGQICKGLNFCLNWLKSVISKFESTQLMTQTVYETRVSIQLMIQTASEVSDSIQLMVQAKIIDSESIHDSTQNRLMSDCNSLLCICFVNWAIFGVIGISITASNPHINVQFLNGLICAKVIGVPRLHGRDRCYPYRPIAEFQQTEQ